MKNPVENAVLNIEERREENKEIEELNLKLNSEIKIEEEAFSKSEFPVDSEFRVNMDKYLGVYDSKTINRDKNTVASRTEKFKEKFTDPVGELLEKSKTLAVNRYWFKVRYLAVRTSKFDDYQNGIDEMLINKETNEVIAAIDATTDVNSKADPRLFSILKDGGQIAYGLRLKDNKPVLGELKNLPVFIVNFNKEETIELAKKVAGQKLPELEERKLLDSLIKQAEIFAQSASSKMRPKYEKALKEFQYLKKELGEKA
jgi:hypothetical protein